MIKTRDLGKSFNSVITQFYESYSFYKAKSSDKDNIFVGDRT